MRKSILITGPQGCGKTKLAIELAENAGNYSVITEAFLYASRFNDFLAERATVVVDECTDIARIKHLASSDRIEIRERMKEARLIPAPNFIFVSGDPAALKLDVDDRRFIAINLAGDR